MSIEAQEQFLKLGFQYYVAARYAFAAHLLPVCGNLFHHAIEMFIKGCHFHAEMEEAEVKRKLKDLGKKEFGHKLILLWVSLKNLHSKSHDNLNFFDDTIEKLDKFWDIRYPNKFLIEKKGMAIVFSWEGFPKSKVKVPGRGARGSK